MAFTIIVTEENLVIQLKHAGEVTVRELEQGREAAVEALKTAGYKRLLVDVRAVETDLTMMEHFSFTTSHIGILPIELKTAVLIRPDYTATAGFVEDVAVNRGISLKVFTDERNALIWLNVPNPSLRSL
jgi:hypothetical protein